MAKGKVRWFDEKKGFGFITPDEGPRDIFVHYSGIAAKGFRTLKENDPVEFETAIGPAGVHAINVVKTEQTDVPPKKRS